MQSAPIADFRVSLRGCIPGGFGFIIDRPAAAHAAFIFHHKTTEAIIMTIFNMSASHRENPGQSALRRVTPALIAARLFAGGLPRCA